MSKKSCAIIGCDEYRSVNNTTKVFFLNPHQEVIDELKRTGKVPEQSTTKTICHRHYTNEFLEPYRGGMRFRKNCKKAIPTVHMSIVLKEDSISQIHFSMTDSMKAISSNDSTVGTISNTDQQDSEITVDLTSSASSTNVQDDRPDFDGASNLGYDSVISSGDVDDPGLADSSSITVSDGINESQKRRRSSDGFSEPKRQKSDQHVESSAVTPSENINQSQNINQNATTDDVARKLANFNQLYRKFDINNYQNLTEIRFRKNEFIEFIWMKGDDVIKRVQVSKTWIFLIEYTDQNYFKWNKERPREISYDLFHKILIEVEMNSDVSLVADFLYIRNKMPEIRQWATNRGIAQYPIDEYDYDLVFDEVIPLRYWVEGECAFLNDHVINIYMQMICKHCRQNTNMPKVCAMDTHALYGKRKRDKINERVAKEVDPFAHDILLVPIHEKERSHWTIIIVHMKEKMIRYYDSDRGANGSDRGALETVRKYLQAESQTKNLTPVEWETRIERDIPRQLNGFDCGVFICMYAKFITAKKPLSFTQHNMKVFRMMMIYEICQRKRIKYQCVTHQMTRLTCQIEMMKHFI